MIVVVTESAEADLEAIADWIAADNPSRALSFVEELRSACRSLASAARRYPLIPRYESAGIRRRVYRDYLILYRISKRTIEILRVLHGAQDFDAVLFPMGSPE